jgi:preprotein translocase subunit YajC
MNQFLFFLEAEATAGTGSFTSILLLYGAIFAIFWFFLIRPQRKKQKQVETMQNSIENGNTVLTSGGLYGKVVDRANDVYTVELGLNKTVRVYVHKSAISSVSEPDVTVVKESKEEKEEE